MKHFKHAEDIITPRCLPTKFNRFWHFAIFASDFVFFSLVLFFKRNVKCKTNVSISSKFKIISTNYAWYSLNSIFNGCKICLTFNPDIGNLWGFFPFISLARGLLILLIFLKNHLWCHLFSVLFFHFLVHWFLLLLYYYFLLLILVYLIFLWLLQVDVSIVDFSLFFFSNVNI